MSYLQGIDLYDMAQIAKEDSQRWFPETSGNLFFTAGCLAGEVGEVLNLLKKVERGSHDMEDVEAKVVEEVADVFTYLLKLAGEMDIDLEQEYKKKRQINEARFGGGSG